MIVAHHKRVFLPRAAADWRTLGDFDRLPPEGKSGLGLLQKKAKRIRQRQEAVKGQGRRVEGQWHVKERSRKGWWQAKERAVAGQWGKHHLLQAEAFTAFTGRRVLRSSQRREQLLQPAQPRPNLPPKPGWISMLLLEWLQNAA